MNPRTSNQVSRLAGLCLLLSGLVSSLALAAEPANTGPWEKVSNKDEILVERRTVAGSNLKEFPRARHHRRPGGARAGRAAGRAASPRVDV